MPPQQDRPRPPQALVFWIIWFAILNGLVMIQLFIGGGIPKGVDRGAPPMPFLAIAVGLAIAALGIRLWVIPQLMEIPKKLTAMMIGLALSEAIGFVGIFAVGKEYPGTQMILLLGAVGCILGFAPVYAKPGPMVPPI